MQIRYCRGSYIATARCISRPALPCPSLTRPLYRSRRRSPAPMSSRPERCLASATDCPATTTGLAPSSTSSSSSTGVIGAHGTLRLSAASTHLPSLHPIAGDVLTEHESRPSGGLRARTYRGWRAQGERGRRIEG